MKTAVAFSLFCIAGIALQAQTGSSGNTAPAACKDIRALINRAWDMEQNLIRAKDSPGPATQVRAYAATADELTRQLLVCGVAERESRDDHDRLMAEFGNLSFILSAQMENGGLAQGQEANFQFPFDLGVVAPACKEILSTDLVPSIERFASEHHDPASLKLPETLPYYIKSTGLPLCALEAQRKGYKDAAIRILSAAFTIENRTSIAYSNQQAAVVRALQEASRDKQVPVQIGSRHCRAALTDWGWQKTVDWDCF